MTKAEIEARMEEREQFIVDILREDPDHTVSGKSIDDACGIKPTNRNMFMRKLMRKYPQIQNVGITEAEFKWVEDMEVISKKNPEGYPDPTPQKAIENTQVTRASVMISPGEVWSAAESNGATRPIFVLNALNGAAQCIKLYSKNEENINIVGPDYFTIDVYGISHIGDPSHVTFKPLRYLTRKLVDVPESKLNEVRRYLSLIFGIKMAKEAEPKVEIKEVPVEKSEPKIPEGYIDTKTAQVAILTEERDIWKTVAMTLLEKN